MKDEEEFMRDLDAPLPGEIVDRRAAVPSADNAAAWAAVIGG